jgi:serine/threonine protein kinase
MDLINVQIILDDIAYTFSRLTDISILLIVDIVHRDLKLENILLSQNPADANDKLHIKVR